MSAAALRARAAELLAFRRGLPAFAQGGEFARLLLAHRAVVVQGETGCGKSTQLPQLALQALLFGGVAAEADAAAEAAAEAVRGAPVRVCVTQPRRVAAVSLCQRVAEEMGSEVGARCGYAVRFDAAVSDATRVKFVTDGMLLREAMVDPMLRDYACIVLDEAHERSVATDILLGLLKRLLTQRDDLRVVVQSASLDAARFAAFLGDDVPVLLIEGRTFPVDVHYAAAPVADYVSEAVSKVAELHAAALPGDVLLFLTGEAEIEEAVAELRRRLNDDSVRVLPLYGALTQAQQMAVFAPLPPGATRKIVVSTNIAETSLTIDGIVHVVDCGFMKQNVYNPRSLVDSLLVTPISKANALQRAGRAGRTRPGTCHRLYTEATFAELAEQPHPEILRTNLAAVLLQMLQIGVAQLPSFPWLDAPAPETVMRALETLFFLGAIDASSALTPLGARMAALPVDPEMGAALVHAAGMHCASDVCAIVAALSTGQIFRRPVYATRDASRAHARFAHDDGDHLMLLNVVEAFEWEAYRASRSAGDGDRGGGGGGGSSSSSEAARGDDDSGAATPGEGARSGIDAWCRANYVSLRNLSHASRIKAQLLDALARLALLPGAADAELPPRAAAAAAAPRRRSSEPPRPPSSITRERSVRVRRALTAGFFLRAAHRDDNSRSYSRLHGVQPADLAPGTCVRGRPSFIIFHEQAFTNRFVLRTVSSIQEEWLLEFCEAAFRPEAIADPHARKVLLRKRKKLGLAKLQAEEARASGDA